MVRIFFTAVFAFAICFFFTDCEQEKKDDVLIGAPLAFPGAEGHGRFAEGGRGGQVYWVTSLEDYNSRANPREEAIPGTLRHAIESIPREERAVILFAVSGTIVLKRNLSFRSDRTIMGHSAPGEGITIASFPVDVGASGIIIRFLRFRMGDFFNLDGVNADGADALGTRRQKNIIVDHCSMSWSTDECVSFYGNENFTMQWCIISESLNNSLHTKGAHGYGGIWGGYKASFIKNLMAHHNSRVPRLGPLPGTSTTENELTDLRNNVFYNYNGEGCYGAEGMNVNIVNNYYKPGPAGRTGDRRNRIIAIDKSTTDPSLAYYDKWGTFYISGNIVDGLSAVTGDNWTYGVYSQIRPAYGITQEEKDALRLSEPLDDGGVITLGAEHAYNNVLDYGGASLIRDRIDERLVNEARTNTAAFRGADGNKPGIIDSTMNLKPSGAGSDWTPYPCLSGESYDLIDSDEDGYPDRPSFDLNGDGVPDEWLSKKYPGKKSTDVNKEGYTLLEVYWNEKVEHITKWQNN